MKNTTTARGDDFVTRVQALPARSGKALITRLARIVPVAVQQGGIGAEHIQCVGGGDEAVHDLPQVA